MLYTSGKNLLTRSDLRKIPITPRGSRSDIWEGVNHGVLADTVIAQAEAHKLKIVREAWYTNSTFDDLFGAVDFAPSDDLSLDIGQDANFSLGVRHSNAGRYAVSFAVGARITVCENGLFAGDFTLKRKHTTGLELENAISDGIKRYLLETETLESFVHSMQAVEVDDKEAAYAIMESGRNRVISHTHLRDVYDKWVNPPHEEFESRNVWSLYNAYTEVVKTLTPQNQVWTLGQLRPFCETQFELVHN